VCGRLSSTYRLFSNKQKKRSIFTNGEKCSRGDGFYPDMGTNCQRFYRCLNSGTPHQLVAYSECPENSLFDSRIESCSSSDLSACQVNYFRSIDQKSIKIEDYVNFKCPRGNGFYPDLASRCKSYYKCQFVRTVWQTVHFVTCPLDSLFDSLANKCLPANQTLCPKKE
jgi:hypothetical protein